jgi:hypothetical protein
VEYTQQDAKYENDDNINCILQISVPGKFSWCCCHNCFHHIHHNSPSAGHTFEPMGSTDSHHTENVLEGN